MKRIYKNVSALLALLLVAVLAPTAALAQVSFRDDFGDSRPVVNWPVTVRGGSMEQLWPILWP
ncbi:MAG TPA: hypothetical protein PLN34_08920 [Alloprevotella sp.]|nr:hypothetical protein [Alloprevotella sp.]